jgi:uncharacterized protein with GYD domain
MSQENLETFKRGLDAYNRRDIDALLEELDPEVEWHPGGGELECIYFGFGEHDAFAIVNLPDDEAAAAVSLIENAAGGATVKTTVLLTPEQVDEAANRAVTYRPPGL